MRGPLILVAAAVLSACSAPLADTPPPTGGESGGSGAAIGDAFVAYADGAPRPRPRVRAVTRTRIRVPAPASRPGVRRRNPPDRGFAAWAHSAATVRIFRCESGWDPRAVNPSGKYRGLIQADADFWATYGGLVYAPRPDEASGVEQLRVAYRGWRARGWRPWSCARIVETP